MVKRVGIYIVFFMIFLNADFSFLTGMTLDEKVDLLNKKMDLKFKFLNKKMDIKFKFLNEKMDIKFAGINKRIDDMSARISSLEARMNTQFSIIIILIAAILGFIICDRISMIKPINKRIEKIERELDINSKDGSKFFRLIETLRKMARSDKKLAAILRSFHLL